MKYLDSWATVMRHDRIAVVNVIVGSVVGTVVIAVLTLLFPAMSGDLVIGIALIAVLPLLIAMYWYDLREMCNDHTESEPEPSERYEDLGNGVTRINLTQAERAALRASNAREIGD